MLLASENPADAQVHPVLFERIDGDLIRSSALRTHGGAEPSALDASGWRRVCTSFSTVSDGLCNVLALLARRLCTEVLDPDSLQTGTTGQETWSAPNWNLRGSKENHK